MLETLRTILKDNWEWRSQIANLSIFELRKKSRGAVLSWSWFFIKPAMYIFCFWFAIEVGLRAGNTAEGAPPFILWLCAGIIPWFFMSDMLNQGTNILRRYPYLVNKIKFPLSGISTIFVSATMIIQLVMQAVLLVIYFVCGQPLDIHLIQIPFLLLLLFVYWDMFSILFSQLSAMSKDVHNLMQALSTPLFWLSGVLFDIRNVENQLIQTLMDYNPVTFFATSFRCVYYDRMWIWEETSMCIGFAIVFVVTFIFMLLAYKRLNEEVADVL